MKFTVGGWSEYSVITFNARIRFDLLQNTYVQTKILQPHNSSFVN